MKKNATLLLVLSSSLIATAGFSQNQKNKEWVFQPGADSGKDVSIQFVEGLPNLANRNFGSSDQLIAESWTFYGMGGSTGMLRFLLDFTDLRRIPQGAQVNHAYLSLYGVPTSKANDRGNVGGNACMLRRVTAPWQEDKVTWNNQPAVTTENQVMLPGSKGVTWNYNVIDLDITKLVQDMINLHPASRNGFLIHLQYSDYYRSMLFASSDNADSAKRPKLRISYDDKPAAGKSTATNAKGTVLKSYPLNGARGRHQFTVAFDAALLALMKENVAILKIKQGKSEISLPFLDE